ncbi:MAG: hypothetical protein R2774_06290 [Saprospiraceae bacterium]
MRNFLIWTVVFIGIAIGLFFSIRSKANAKVNEITIHYSGAAQGDQLISKNEVLNILSKKAKKPINNTNIQRLNFRVLEAELNKDERIEKADLYLDANNRLHVRILQKKPIMRVLTDTDDYYIDVNGHQIKNKPGSISRVPIVTGINETYDKAIFTNKLAKSHLKNIFEILSKTADDEFLSALIEQVTISQDSLKDIVLIPKIGREKIVFGDASNIDGKIQNLKIFYKDGLPQLGWNRYKKLNLKLGNQVVGTLINPSVAHINQPIVKRDSLTADATEIQKKISIHN